MKQRIGFSFSFFSRDGYQRCTASRPIVEIELGRGGMVDKRTNGLIGENSFVCHPHSAVTRLRTLFIPSSRGIMKILKLPAAKLTLSACPSFLPSFLHDEERPVESLARLAIDTAGDEASFDNFSFNLCNVFLLSLRFIIFWSRRCSNGDGKI